MSLVHLQGPPAALASDADPAWKWAGWGENDRLLAAAALGRDSTADAVRIHVLAALERPDARPLLLNALAEVVNAAVLVAEAAADELPVYEASGFSCEPSTGACTRLLDASVFRGTSTLTLAGLQAAIEAAWCAETSASPDTWSPERPALGQCDVTARLVRDLLGGELLTANVIKDGRRLERHAWNRLPSGIELDLTRSQYVDGEAFGKPAVGELIGLGGLESRYELFAERFSAASATGAEVRHRLVAERRDPGAAAAGDDDAQQIVSPPCPGTPGEPSPV